ncbi:TetR/AcrR family transcriptional regulator [Flavobacterium sp. UMI-01]|uniref:TetR/AcrR family transcriptional regulator n=1 Tax=Flavobacterium sp. UMI-01 TaxID=1441053 RepID=UPI001C7CB022|nr:TetR/AcrR family transcriptional regulator [Flavobacterium sp. UMI-01]GIZ08978.1 TetR family transcriptional regulator [Flavobacterium sp. UMI-01]
MLSGLKIKVNEKIYVKDPETSVLGKKILQESIFLINEIGFDNFTFKKLGDKIGSNESSIYRYFENKHKLLVYLCSWYWSWVEYKMVFKMTNIDDPFERLKRAITVVTEKAEEDLSIPHINESVLNTIIIAEFTKTLHTKEVDDENKEGFFLIYKSVINRLIQLIEEVNPKYPYPKSLASSIIEGGLHQYFLKDHLKTITDCNEQVSPTDFYLNLISTVLKK